MNERWEAIKWRGFVARWWVQARAVAIVCVVAVVLLGIATLTHPLWTLRFEKVLAWPVIALIAFLLFRRQIGALVQGRGLRKANLGPGGLSLELEADEQVESAAPIAVPGDVDTEVVILSLGLLAQLYQFQIDFLKHVGQTENLRLSREATEQWFRDKVGAENVDADEEVTRLITFLVERNTLVTDDDDHYALTKWGQDFLSHITGFWYAPKLF